jgi:hypothetical protein
MTDLKQLLDDAAGPEPAVTDTDLATDLTRGHRALRRRRATGIASGAVAVAAVIGVGWSLLPSATPNGAPGPAAEVSVKPSATAAPKTTLQTTPKTTPTKPGTSTATTYTPPVPPSAKDDPRPIPPTFATEVPLVANTTAFPGPITCDLIPKGWAVRTNKDGLAELYDPKLTNPGKYRALSSTVTLRPSELKQTSNGLITDRTDSPWGAADMGMTHAGTNEAIVFPIKDSDGQDHPWQLGVYVRQGKSLRIVDVANYAWPLAWNVPSQLKFAGSCHYK